MGIYEELGVRPFINAADNYTRFGGSIMWPCAVLTLSPWGRIVHIAHARGVPVLVDAAFSIPPKVNFRYFTRDLSVDAIIASGGKAIRGPQTTGLVIGKRSIIEGSAAHGNPNRAIGRTMKVGKEELAGIYASVKYIMERDEDAVRKEINRMGLDIRKGLSSSSLVKSVRRSGPGDPAAAGTAMRLSVKGRHVI